ncbi:MAG: ornithine carbamoyltransferase [candidate division WOR-3 bacterium]|uniref:Ornithine carbamoyltransferase n=3 Tax=candidate division WOR-3 bacterium TaxID=2052148 RepID=A0A7C1NGX2_UNCW3|nr:ornithine carbamoyltransferase [candidate division WOR-3 bacterium]
MKKDLTSIADLSKQEILDLLHEAGALKAEISRQGVVPLARGKMGVLIFEKPSLRTRVTFERALHQLGATSTYLSPSDVGLGVRESVPDVARNLSRWVNCIIARVFEHEKITQLAENATIPVINALSDLEHPCQILADLLTIVDHRGSLEGVTVAWTGDGNNVCHSLMLAAATVGFNLNVATPKGFEPAPAITEQTRKLSEKSGAKIRLTYDPCEAVAEADFIYTDVWASMGQENEAEQRRQIFRPYQVNRQLLSRAKPETKVLHCLPAHRGEEITDEVLDGPQSVVLDQAENRLHIQRAILARLLRNG